MDLVSGAQTERTRKKIKEDTPTKSAMEKLPREVVLDIFARLPTTSLLDVKLVSRSWRRLVQDPVLVNMHFLRKTENEPCLILHSDYPIKNQLCALYIFVHSEGIVMVKKIPVPALPEFEVLGSCKGWLCLCDLQDNPAVHIYNPLTSEFMELPKSTQGSDSWKVLGFGFHPTTKEYKLVKIAHKKRNAARISHHFEFSSSSEVRVFTLGSHSWRSIGIVRYHLNRSPSQVLVNGRLHWVDWPLLHSPGCTLISFDLADERFREVETPDSPHFQLSYKPLVLGGCLSAAVYLNWGKFDVWIMKDYGLKQSWVKEFRIGADAYIPRGLEQSPSLSLKASKLYCASALVIVLCRLKNGEVLLQYHCGALVSYDPSSGTFRDIKIRGMPNYFEGVAHINSLSAFDSLRGTT